MRATNWVGDAVMSLPALRVIRGRFPQAEITIQARPSVADLYAREHFADSIMLYGAARGAHGFAAKWRAAQEIRRERFDCAILLPNSFDSALIPWLAGVPRRIGYSRDGRGFLLTDRIRPPLRGEMPRHERYYYLELLRRAGLLDSLLDGGPIALDGAGEAREQGLRRFEALGVGEPVIGVSPGAAYGNAKRWLPERFAEAAVAIASVKRAAVAVFGSRDEKNICAEVEAAVTAAGCKALNLAGTTTLARFIEFAAACILFLTNDSGAMHIAYALGVPSVTVFGATDEEATGPSGPLARIVREPVDCSPCLLRECPIDHRCMTRVAAQRVAAEALDLLK